MNGYLRAFLRLVFLVVGVWFIVIASMNLAAGGNIAREKIGPSFQLVGGVLLSYFAWKFSKLEGLVGGLYKLIVE
jgi:hypothetical protein